MVYFRWLFCLLCLSLSSIAQSTPVIDIDQDYDGDLMEFMDYDDDQLFCRAVVILLDSRDGFKSESDAFDWCFGRVRGWRLDESKGWRDRFCSISRHEFKDDYGDRYFRWNSRFRHQDADFRTRYRGRVFYALEQRYGARVFRGTGLNFQVQFHKDCKFKG
jgi:hypothetical protein